MCSNGWICHGMSTHIHTSQTAVIQNYMDGILLLLFNIVP